jgi:hypothetical protein
VFDLNGVLAAKMTLSTRPGARPPSLRSKPFAPLGLPSNSFAALGVPSDSHPPPPSSCRWAHVRLPPPSPLRFLLRPGASKLLRMLDAEGHWVWLWSTMQPQTVHTLGHALAPWLPPHRMLSAPDCEPGSSSAPSPPGSLPTVKDLRVIWRRSERRHDGSAPCPSPEGEAQSSGRLAASRPRPSGARPPGSASSPSSAPHPEHTLLFDDDPAKALDEQREAHYVRVATYAPASPWDLSAVDDREMLRILALVATRIHPPERS